MGCQLRWARWGISGCRSASRGRARNVFERAVGLKKQFEFDDRVAVGNENVTIALHKGKPSSKTLGHMSFHLPNLSALRKALARLQRIEEDRGLGDEIGPEAPG